MKPNHTSKEGKKKQKIKYVASLVKVTFEGKKKVNEEVVKKVMTKNDLDMLDLFLFPFVSHK